jgi:cytoskeletal protein CcmA (bactofilin family)
MLKKSNTKAVSKATDAVDTLIGVNTVIQGDLEFSGGLRIDGQITGNIKSVDGNNGTVILSESAIIEGNISVPHVIVNGNVNGNIIASERIELQTKAVIKGDVRYRAVEMALGASVNGALVCDSSTSAMGVGAKKSGTGSSSQQSSGSKV